MLHAGMGTVTVRVIPRSDRGAVEAGDDVVVVRVRSAPERGRATEEARRLLAGVLRVPVSHVTLRVGARSRTKIFEVEDLPNEAIEMRLRGT